MVKVASREGIWLVAAALVLALGTPARAQKPGAQLDFGVKMARQGLWSEALFRFEQALSLAPGNARILNNLAVAYEAVGRFEDALATYQKALQMDPGNRDLKRNYSQFLEFYQGFKPRGPEDQAPAEEASEAPPGS